MLDNLLDTQQAHAGILNNELSPVTLDIITSNPAAAINKAEQLLKQKAFAGHTFSFSEHAMAGNLMGDMVLTSNNLLVNYKKRQDELALEMQDMVHALNLQVTLQNPVLLRFQSAQSNVKPSTFDVYQNNVLVAQLPINQALRSRRFESTQGYVDLSVENGKASIVGSSCKHKTCMKLGTISDAGESLVCIPSGIRIATAGENKWGVDSVTF